MTTLRPFQGDRLQQAREVRQLTAASLAERVGVSGASVSHWEKGLSQPRPDFQAQIAKVLELPESFFLRPLPSGMPTVFRFRSLSAATKRARTAAHGRAQWLHELAGFLRDEVDIPPVDVPHVDLPKDPESLRPDDVELAAEQTRRAWGLRDGPIPDLTKLIEAHGVVVSRLSLNAAGLDGLSTWSGDGRPFIVLNSEKGSCVRSRFDAAHELGHLVLHRLAPDRPSTAVYKLMEQQAHQFAGAFLFPKSAMIDEVASAHLDSLVRLKERWRLSIGAMVVRLGRLGLIGEGQKESLQRQIGIRGWRSWEPLDDSLPPERPSLLRRAYRLLCDEGGWTPSDIMRSVPLAEHDHEQLTGLPARWMHGQPEVYGDLVQLRRGADGGRDAILDGDRVATLLTSDPGKVIAFPSRRPRQPDLLPLALAGREQARW